ncbi:MAG: NTP transferase domain-containing protein [Desulfurococcales archaeon]|nr:NTP transferase domain-containing protein [Desulfurococcales archaeon]
MTTTRECTSIKNGVTALIPAAGLGTRMTPATKEMPKEMLPVPARYGERTIFKPFIQLIYETLYKAGIRTFVFVVGRGKRILQDHFLPDWGLYDTLMEKGKTLEAESLKELYLMLENSNIIWVDQPSPKGLGDAVLRGLKAVNTEYVLIHLGDILLKQNNNDNIVEDMLRAFNNLGEKCRSLIHSLTVPDPQNYGVIVPGTRLMDGIGQIEEIFTVRDLVEKPRDPPSNYAITGIYLLPSRELLYSLENTPRNPNTGELELTDGLRLLLSRGHKMCTALSSRIQYLDIGRPDRYLDTFISLSKLS